MTVIKDNNSGSTVTLRRRERSGFLEGRRRTQSLNVSPHRGDTCTVSYSHPSHASPRTAWQPWQPLICGKTATSQRDKCFHQSVMLIVSILHEENVMAGSLLQSTLILVCCQIAWHDKLCMCNQSCRGDRFNPNVSKCWIDWLEWIFIFMGSKLNCQLQFIENLELNCLWPQSPFGWCGSVLLDEMLKLVQFIGNEGRTQNQKYTFVTYLRCCLFSWIVSVSLSVVETSSQIYWN